MGPGESAGAVAGAVEVALAHALRDDRVADDVVVAAGAGAGHQLGRVHS